MIQSGHTPEKGPSYCIVSGSTSAAMMPEEPCQVLVVVESEFDAILLKQEAGHLAGMVAIGSASARPDKRAFEILRDAELILVALDSDDQREDGQNPGAKESQWWMQHFPQARRLPPIEGKDPGEMWANGIKLAEWVRIGINKYFPQTHAEKYGQNGNPLDWQNENSLDGQNGNPLDNAALIQVENTALIREVASQPVVSQPLDNQPIAPKQDPAGPVPVPIPILEQLIPDPVSEQLIPDPDFSKADLIVKLHSDLLNEDFFLVSDGELRARVRCRKSGDSGLSAGGNRTSGRTWTRPWTGGSEAAALDKESFSRR